MAAQATVQHRLRLVVRLIDATTGREITERSVSFCLSPPGTVPIARGGGIYLFLGADREDFSIGVRVYGYEPETVKICFERLNPQMPIQEIYLLPVDETAQGDRVLTLRGELPGIQAIEAVSLTENYCCIRTFDVKRRVMTVLNPHNVKLIHTHYGLVSKDRASYEPIWIEEELSSQEIRLREPLTQEFTINQPLTRILYGQVKADGTYTLKVRDSQNQKQSQNAQYLIRFTVKGKEFFQKMDFYQLKELQLPEEEE